MLGKFLILKVWKHCWIWCKYFSNMCSLKHVQCLETMLLVVPLESCSPQNAKIYLTQFDFHTILTWCLAIKFCLKHVFSFLWLFILTLFQCIQVIIYFVDKMNRNPEKHTDLWFLYHQTWIGTCFNHMLALNGTKLCFYLSSWYNLYPVLYFLLVILNETGSWLCHPLIRVFYCAF